MKTTFRMPVLLLGLFLACSPAMAAGEPSADGVFVPPSLAKVESAAFTIEQLRGYADSLSEVTVFTQFDGAQDALQAKYSASSGGLRGGEVVSVDMTAAELAPTALEEGDGWRVYLGGLVSVGAEALRLQMDLSALAPGDELWVIGPATLTAFGPYTVLDGADESRWLASTQGDEAVVMIRTWGDQLPPVRLVAYSHIFLPLEVIAKELSCNIDIACEADANLQNASSAAAIILVGGMWFCTGQLLNNSQTAALEPFFVTANHCICSRSDARDTEVYWDFRNSTCNGGDAPSFDSLARSDGEALLATNALLDITLIRLDSVPSGDYGRAYLGWDSRLPVVGEAIVGIHHPDATRMRISKGTIQAVNETKNGRESQTKVHWDEGVTENGSSGSMLLFASSLRLLGVLSQGPQHTCGPDRSGNVDWFASLREFYPAIAKYIDSATPSTAEGGDDCGGTVDVTCPLAVTFSDRPELLTAFRSLRDDTLLKSASGRRAVGLYYRAAPCLARALQRSEAAQRLFALATEPVGEWLLSRTEPATDP